MHFQIWALPKPKHGLLTKLYPFSRKIWQFHGPVNWKFHCLYIPFDLLIFSSLTHHYSISQHPMWLRMLVPGGCQARGRNSYSLSGPWRCSLPLVLLSSPDYQRLLSPGEHSTDAKSEVCTCSLVAIIRKMTQQHGVAEDDELLESSVKMFRAAHVQTQRFDT